MRRGAVAAIIAGAVALRAVPAVALAASQQQTIKSLAKRVPSSHMVLATMTRAGQHYGDEKGARYFAYQAWSGEFGARADRFKFAGQTSASDTVVDFGCGNGAILATLSAAQRIGVEPNPLARQAAAKRGIRTVPSAADLGPSTADVVISNHALEHALSPFDELRALRAALKPGGRLVLWLPLDDWRTQKVIDPDDPNHHLYCWTPLLIGNLLTEAGYLVKECRIVSHVWPWRAEIFFRLLPEPVFHALCRGWSVVFRRRQLAVVAVKPSDGDGYSDNS